MLTVQEQVAQIFVTGLLMTVYLAIGIVIALIIQGIVYKATGFSIYNYIEKLFDM